MGKDDATWLRICYFVFAGICAYISYQAIDTIGGQLGWSERFDGFAMASNIAALALGAGAAFWMWRSKDRREYHQSAIAEIRKVTWPTFPHTKQMTVVVAVVVAIFGVILALYDLAWTKALESILP